MTELELKRLKRNDLLQMLLDQSKELEGVRAQLMEANKKLEKREIELNEAGSIAEASLQLNGVFTAAQKACDQYMESIKSLRERQEVLCNRAERQSQEEAERLLTEAKRQSQELCQNTEAQCKELKETTEVQCKELKETTEAQCKERKEATETSCEEMLEKAREESQAYWTEVYKRMDAFCREHESLRALFASTMEQVK